MISEYACATAGIASSGLRGPEETRPFRTSLTGGCSRGFPGNKGVSRKSEGLSDGSGGDHPEKSSIKGRISAAGEESVSTPAKE